MDDTHMINNENAEKAGIVLGSYGLVEWIDSDFRRDRHLNGKTTAEREFNYVTRLGFDLTSWVAENGFEKYTFFDASHVIITPSENLLMTVRKSRSKISVCFIGDPKEIQYWADWFSERFEVAENLVRWVYDERGNDIEVSIRHRPLLKSAYPQIRGDADDYIEDYLKSDASVLILIGPPGTGKTTFIKNIILKSASQARVAYDEKVLSNDGFFAMFIDSQDDILVMEDADAFLSSRSDGNTMMHRFLNVSDGLISITGKKLIFSTNLPNATDIDPALMRTGRCFDVLHFTPLSRAQAIEVHKEAGCNGELRDGFEFTLAEIFSQQPSDKPMRKMGF